MKQNFQLLSLRFSVTSFLLPIRKYSLRKCLALTVEPPFLSHYSFVCLYVTPFSNPSACQPFSVSLSFSQRSCFPSLLSSCCAGVDFEVGACLRRRPTNRDRWAVRVLDSRPCVTPWRCLKKVTRLNMPATTFFKRWMTWTQGQHRRLLRTCFTPWWTFFPEISLSSWNLAAYKLPLEAYVLVS